MNNKLIEKLEKSPEEEESYKTIIVDTGLIERESTK